jgi:hypothetical protein
MTGYEIICITQAQVCPGVGSRYHTKEHHAKSGGLDVQSCIMVC